MSAQPRPCPFRGCTGMLVGTRLGTCTMAASHPPPEKRRPKPALVAPVDHWPKLDRSALYGVLGEIVQEIEPHSEADPAALLVDFLVSFGASVNTAPHVVADGAAHPARLNAVIVGETSRARKGTSRANVARVMTEADPWLRVVSGLSTGEGLIAAVRDGDGEEDQGVTDKRLLVTESEFARVLSVITRQGNTLSAVVRDCWDSGRLHVITRKDPLTASGAHVCVVAHITMPEVNRNLTETESANGFANRFLWICARRSKVLPTGGTLTDDDFRRFGRLMRKSLEGARKVGRMFRSGDAEILWDRLYRELAEEDPPGLVGAITARAEAQLLRLSVVYALTDGSNTIETEHLEAAWALWRYASESAAYVFGGRSGDPDADKLLAALSKAGTRGMDFTAQRDLFGRHKSVEDLERLRRALGDRIVTVSVPTNGRPVSVSFLSDYATEATKATEVR